MQLYQAYRPLTATPGISRELPPCAELAPYIRCFWAGNAARPSLIVPDTCADLIFRVDTASGAVRAYFCGVNDAPFTSGAQLGSTFGIRFYAWAAVLFTAEDMRATRNNNMTAEQYFPTLTRALAPMLPYTPSLAERAALAMPLLLASLRPSHTDGLVTAAIGELLASGGLQRTATLAVGTAYQPAPAGACVCRPNRPYTQGCGGAYTLPMPVASAAGTAGHTA